MRKQFFYIVLLFLSAACSKQEVKTFSDYMKWMNNPENGLVKTKYVNGIELNVKYLPSEYLAYRELKNENHYTAKQKDSVLSLYAHSISFLLTLGPDQRKGEGGNIMYKSVADYKEYTQRVMDMNFFMEDHIVLKAGDTQYRPVLSQMDNTYEADVKRNIILVFVPQEKEDKNLNGADALEFKYDDQLFQLGTNYFLFDRNDLKKIPAIKFWTNKG